MNGVEKLKAELELPPINHIGVVVRNIDKAIQYYSSIFGLGPFTVYEFEPEKHWFMGEPSPIKLILAKAMWDNIELELLQHLEGKTIHKEFLDTHGEGLQHLGFLVPNYEEMYDKFRKAGFAPLMRAETYVETYKGNLKACYFDTRRVGGIIFEIVWRSWVKLWR
jgi:methylmalonyl-CoA/ethylmalonyl-CoA epimerase